MFSIITNVQTKYLFWLHVSRSLMWEIFRFCKIIYPTCFLCTQYTLEKHCTRTVQSSRGGGEVVHYDFLKLRYTRNKMEYVGQLAVGALPCVISLFPSFSNELAFCIIFICSGIAWGLFDWVLTYFDFCSVYLG